MLSKAQVEYFAPSFPTPDLNFSVLFAHDGIFIAQAVVWTAVICTLHKSKHFILVKIYFADIAFAVVIVRIIRAVVTAGFSVCQVDHP